MRLAIKIQNIAKALLPSSVFDLFLWHKTLAGTRRADWHRLSLHTSFHVDFLHQVLKCPNGSASSSIRDTTKQLPDPWGDLRRRITILQISTVFMWRQDAPAHVRSFSMVPALLQRLRMQGRWHRTGCVASRAGWGAEGALIARSSCMPSSCDQKRVSLSSTYLSLLKTTEGRLSLDEFQHFNVFADKTKTGQWTNSAGEVSLRVDLDHLLAGIFFE